MSPDGRTLLCVGDSSDVHLHRITGGSRLSFAPIATLSLSAHIQHSHDASGGLSQVSSIPASFSTAFSADGAKFAVASQEGVVVVWDVRSTKPLRVFSTDRARAGVPGPVVPGRIPTGAGSGWMYESPWDWARPGARAPGWGVRSVKFSPPGVGREVMTFTEVRAPHEFLRDGKRRSPNPFVALAHVPTARRRRTHVRDGGDRAHAEL